ncbi:GTP-binding protein ypt1, putative [Entamoeba dispar SAW760]|uniref:GTP-binding protein ypt1, putative n=1 Tax=Entamoeba dispar (strain ATCC PRA-260 / SAW760) TaxID=370354 RepID=B0EHY6_ENTDS|nr:GTP-binding protein ypt1, putative [Entamoeba dispar SAW760]EDR25930.1 GTP-binding protein ypt1, putative [Entamoeba dispar SAW760]|eukprot:EDR25930.1 GTP-binding protein ypt1, putative [Entamoeba dispar SAW760]
MSDCVTSISYNYLFKVLLVGDPNVGKSSLLSRYIDNVFNEDTTTSIGVDFKFKSIFIDNVIVKCQIYDTAGQEKFREIGNSYYNGAHAALLVFDGGDISTFQGLEIWLQDIRKYNTNIKILLVCNKCDQPVNIPEGTISLYAKEISEEGKWIKTSAKNGEGVTEAFETVIRLLLPKKNEGNSIAKHKKKCTLF